jgi:DNA invertase Pin-like site-specific DNA recombinase
VLPYPLAPSTWRRPTVARPLAIYVRVSRRGDRDDGRFHSPREQEARARAHAEARGHTTDGVYADIDVSGAIRPAERPEMGRLLEALDRGEVGGIAAFDLSRLSREPAHGDWLVRRVTDAGGLITTPDMPDDVTSATGEFQFGIMLQVARLYRRSAGERIETAKERAIRAGIPVSPTPIGYRKRADRTLEPDPETAPVVRELFERRAAGDGYGRLAELLAARTGRTWSRQAVAHILRNRLYATGRLQRGDVVSEVEAGALVDEPLWQAVQRAAPKPRPPRDPDARWLLSGLLRCGTCGRSLAPWVGSKAKRERPARRYRCQNRACRARASVDAGRAEKWVLLQTFAAVEGVAARSRAPDLSALEDDAARAERRLEQVLAPEARDALGDLWAADAKARRLERDDALARLGEARAAAEAPDVDLDLPDVWEGLSQHDRREALAALWKEIVVYPRAAEGTRIKFVARGPLSEAAVVLPVQRREAGP